MMAAASGANAQQVSAASDAVPNAERLINEAENQLAKSRIVAELDAPVGFNALVPQRYELRLTEYLRTQNLRLRMDDAHPRLELRLFTENKLEQAGRQNGTVARRQLRGELHLFLSNEQAEITDTEVLAFSYEDMLSGNSMEDIAAHSRAGSEWAATQFAEVSTRPDRPGRWKRYGEPAILTAATGITVFLLFNVRS